MGFGITTVAKILGLATPLAEAMGVPMSRNLMETSEDFAEIENLGLQLAELGAAGRIGLADGNLSADEMQKIIAEAQDVPTAAKNLLGEAKDRELGSTPATRAAGSGGGSDDLPNDLPPDDANDPALD